MLLRVATVTIAKTKNGVDLLCVTIGSIFLPESLAVGSEQKLPHWARIQSVLHLWQKTQEKSYRCSSIYGGQVRANRATP
jgi:hypothetical protein